MIVRIYVSKVYDFTTLLSPTSKKSSSLRAPAKSSANRSNRVIILAFIRDLLTRKVNDIDRVFKRELDVINVKIYRDLCS